MLASHAVRRENAPAIDRPVRDQLQLHALSNHRKKRHTAAEQHRMDVDTDFIDDILGEERSRELSAAEDADAFSALCLQRANEGSGIVAHEVHGVALYTIE